MSAELIGGTVASAFLAVGVALLSFGSRSKSRACRVCGGEATESDMCQKCRKDAAERVRRAAAERQKKESAKDEEQRRYQQRDADLKARIAREAEQARQMQEELAKRVEAERLQREQLAAPRAAAPAAQASTAIDPMTGEEVFDPYKVLNIPRELSKEFIELVYHEAKKRLDPDLVEFCGDEAKAHFKAKAEALDRAYEILVLMR
jgi:flagellar biosynthesis GTPase FlhF